MLGKHCLYIRDILHILEALLTVKVSKLESKILPVNMNNFLLIENTNFNSKHDFGNLMVLK